VPGGAGDVGDDGPLIPRQGVEQRRLARVGPAHNSRADAGFQYLSPAAGVQQPLQPPSGGPEGSGDLLRPHILNVLVRVVHHRVKPGG
ncbi:helix-turn-helix domain-containing protein, partial [Dysosmobacter welbionis]